MRLPVEPCLSSHQAPRWNVTCAHGWQNGGGLYIYIRGTATLTDTNVYENHAKVRSPVEPSLSPHPAPHSTDCRCAVRWLTISQGQGSCNIYSDGALVLRNISVALSQSSCPSGVMLDLAEATTIQCPLGLWVPPSPFALPPMNFTVCPYQCAAGHFGNTSQEQSATCTGECNGGGEYCPAGTAQPLPCPAGTYLPPLTSASPLGSPAYWRQAAHPVRARGLQP